jgi:hypothetical protein
MAFCAVVAIFCTDLALADDSNTDSMPKTVKFGIALLKKLV